MWFIIGALLTVIDMCFHTHLFRLCIGIQLGLLAIIFIFVILALAFS
jgi:hypothetical protein